MTNKFYTYLKINEGFGAQYQKIIQTYIYCKKKNLDFVYKLLENVDHNYNNDSEYNNKLEELINLKHNISPLQPHMDITYLDFGTIVIPYFESNIDECCESEHMKFIKECFWKNKNRNFYNNDKINVAVHIRRDNSFDKGLAGERVTTSNSYYLNIMNNIRQKYCNYGKELLFHVYSQGDISNFTDLEYDDVVFYLDYDIVKSFIGMVVADILIISPSSFSYVAALISDGEIYYKRFWHNPRKNWIIC